MHDAVPFPRSAVALALLAVVLGRGVAQALPGTFTGIDGAIEVVELSGAICSQLAAGLLTALAVRSAAFLLFTQTRRPMLTVATALTSGAVATMTLLAALLTHNQLATQWSVLLAGSVIVVLAWSGAQALARPVSRAAGLIAIGAAVAATLHTLGRVTALEAADRASVLGFGVARGLASAGSVVELGSIVGALVWLLSPRHTKLRASGSLLLALVPALALGATRDQGWGLVVGRTLEQLSSHPDPMLPTFVRNVIELTAIATAALCAMTTSRAAGPLMAVGLCMLGRASADIPLGSVFLLNAALALQLMPAEPDRAPLEELPTS